jgi:hypothetical protein
MSLLVLLSLAAGGCFSLLAIVYKTAERRQCRAIPFAFAFVRWQEHLPCSATDFKPQPGLQLHYGF